MKTKDPSLQAFIRLGAELRRYTDREGTAPSERAESLDALLREASVQNAWFTREECLHALGYWGEMLREETLASWLAPYPEPSGNPLTVALVLAGNIPLVGFHDFLCVLATGNRALAKCASNDRLLLPYLAGRLIGLEPTLKSRIAFTDGPLEGFDAVIATGSNNTSRYFEYYFSKKPHIIRRNRNAVAVLTGGESPEELQGLATDVFRYFGMGCRSVSKLLVPEGYDFDPLFQAFYGFRQVIEHPKYANNYDYNKAVYLMSGSPMLDNGFLLLKEDRAFGSPIGTLFYETYGSREALQTRLEAAGEDLQCVVSGDFPGRTIPFGMAQWPGLSDYADGVDTVDFLLKTSSR